MTKKQLFAALSTHNDNYCCLHKLEQSFLNIVFYGNAKICIKEVKKVLESVLCLNNEKPFIDVNV